MVVLTSNVFILLWGSIFPHTLRKQSAVSFFIWGSKSRSKHTLWLGWYLSR